MKSFLIFAVLLAPISSVLAQDFLGIYKTKPELFPGFSEPYPENVKKVIDAMRWRMTITSEGVVIETNLEDPSHVPYSYIVDGKFLLAELEESGVKKYVPFYIENNQTIHGFGTIFYRVE